VEKSLRRRTLSPFSTRRMLRSRYAQSVFAGYATPLTVLQAKSHGNEPSKGAKIDQELREEDEAALKGKGSFGPK